MYTPANINESYYMSLDSNILDVNPVISSNYFVPADIVSTT